MRYRIISDNPGRIRVRFGGYAFDKTLEGCIVKLAIANSYVVSAEAHSANGSLLIRYKKGYRNDVIGFIESLNFRSMTPVPRDEGTAGIDNHFRKQLIKLGVNHFVRKLIIPAPLRPISVIYRGIKYILKGLSVLAEGRLTVEVLDAASITACLAQRNFSTARTIMLLLSVSSLLEEYTHARTKAVLTSSLAVKADKVWLVSGDEDILISIKELKAGDRIRVRTGSVIPVDGEITDGEAYINEASMTGEPLAVIKSADATVFAGTVVEEGSVVIKVRAVNSDTRIQKIIELIDSSENLKAGIQSRAERLADKIVPFSFLGFVLTLLLTRNITKAVSLLMVDYSCAIKLSTPISVISAIREASELNITVKGGKYLEAFASADTIVFDKTGTLTKAQPTVAEVISFNGENPDELLRIAACMEEHFPHSMAKAVVEAAREKQLTHEEMHSKVEYIVAHGIVTTIEGKRAIIGSHHFVFEDEGCRIPEGMQAGFDALPVEYSHLYLAIEQQLAAVICIEDPLREEAEAVIASLKDAGFKKVVMMTGDSERTARAIAHRVGVDEYYSEVLPEDKAGFVEEEKAKGRKVIMIGDGVNDSPALSAADVGIAISDGAQIAREIADITIGADNLYELVKLKSISDGLMKRIDKNYHRIVGINTALIVLGVSGVITPTTSALLHNTSTLAISLQSMKNLLSD